MIPEKIKKLIDKYCMGVTPSDEQMDEIMNLVLLLNADGSEVSEYMKKKIAGPTKEELEDEKKRKALKEKEAAEKKAAKDAERKAQELAKQKAIEDAKKKIMEHTKLQPVDLGLSVKWASANLGASKPNDYGEYYAWGETETKDVYNWEEYELSDESDNSKVRKFAELNKAPELAQEMFKYCTDSSHSDVDGLSILEREDDAAAVNMRNKLRFWEKCKWRMATIEEWNELQEKCEWIWTNINGCNGFLFSRTVYCHRKLNSFATEK